MKRWRIVRKDGKSAEGADAILWRDHVEALKTLCDLVPESDLENWQLVEYESDGARKIRSKAFPVPKRTRKKT